MLVYGDHHEKLQSFETSLRSHPESFTSLLEADEEHNLTELQTDDYVMVKFIVNPPSDTAHTSKSQNIVHYAGGITGTQLQPINKCDIQIR